MHCSCTRRSKVVYNADLHTSFAANPMYIQTLFIRGKKTIVGNGAVPPTLPNPSTHPPHPTTNPSTLRHQPNTSPIQLLG